MVGFILLGFRVTLVVVGWGVVVVGVGRGWWFRVRGRLRFSLPFRFGCGLLTSNIWAISLCTFLPSGFLPWCCVVVEGFCGVVEVFSPGMRVVTAADAPTPGGMEWGHSWRPIWSEFEQLEQ